VDEENLRNKTDFDDYNRELSGISGAQASRFLNADGSPITKSEAEEKARKQAFQDQLDILMQNPAFAAAYRDAGKAIDDTQAVLNRAMMTTAANIERLIDLVEDMEDRTAKLPDGTVVFKTKDGQLKAADGGHLSETETASLLNPENLLDYDAYQNAQGALQSARARQDKYGAFQTDIEDARKNRDNAKTPKELRDIERDMNTVKLEIEQENSIDQEFGQAAEQPVSELTSNLELEMKSLNF